MKSDDSFWNTLLYIIDVLKNNISNEKYARTLTISSKKRPKFMLEIIELQIRRWQIYRKNIPTGDSPPYYTLCKAD